VKTRQRARAGRGKGVSAGTPAPFSADGDALGAPGPSGVVLAVAGCLMCGHVWWEFTGPLEGCPILHDGWRTAPIVRGTRATRLVRSQPVLPLPRAAKE
jgi:hypothetical protein